MTIDQQWGDMMDETEFGGFTVHFLDLTALHFTVPFELL